MTSSWSTGSLAHSAAANPQGHGDLAIVLCETWHATHDATLALCRKQQRMETHLIRTIGFPYAQVRFGTGEQMVVHSVERVIAALPPGQEALLTKAIAEIASHQARWDAADKEMGYSQTQSLERHSAETEQSLLDSLTSTPASSMAGVSAKLGVILREGQGREEPADFPWPHIRSVLQDLVRLMP